MKNARNTSRLLELARTQKRGNVQDKALERLFSIEEHISECRVGSELKHKYVLERAERQTVISVTNRVSGEQSWFNEIRSRKPQTFRSTNVGGNDPTLGGGFGRCDFCDWHHYTAEDTFGRIENEHAVTASNLFKFNPYHGLILFKHHEPLDFDFDQLNGLLDAAMEWLERAYQHSRDQHPAPMFPLFIWNCLPRSGASQYHGHAQTLLSPMPFPEQDRLLADIVSYRKASTGANYLGDLLAAHASAGLARQTDIGEDKAYCYASLTPLKDKELVVQGSEAGSMAFRRMLFTALRALIDCMGVETFNLVIQNINVGEACSEHAGLPVMARMVSRGSMKSNASDFGALEVFAGASLAHTEPHEVISGVDVKSDQLPWSIYPC